MQRAPVSRDGEVLLLLCSFLGLPKGDQDGGPLTVQEWNGLAARIAQSPLERPGALLGLDAASLADALGVPPALGGRLHRLLARAGPLAIELERLSSLGIWAVTRADEGYPDRLKEVLGPKAPPCLFGAGDPELLARDAIAIVGSRDLDDEGREFAERVGRRCASAGLAVVSGGAKGTDRHGMTGALEAGGLAVGVLADSLERSLASRDVRQWIVGEQLTLITQFHPKAGFSVGNAMQRNKLIYGLARAAVVVASDLEKGGTWAGAVEDLQAGWVPLYVRGGDAVPEGNRALLKRGATQFPQDALDGDLRILLEPPSDSTGSSPTSVQAALFDLGATDTAHRPLSP